MESMEGGPQAPSGLRQETMPLPLSPPKPTASFFSEGTTATQAARAMISPGTPLSGAAMISLRTSAAFRMRSPSFEAERERERHSASARVSLRIALIVVLLPFDSRGWLVGDVEQDGAYCRHFEKPCGEPVERREIEMRGPGGHAVV